ncbi:cyclophilin-like domain-containing protein [Rhodotorula diobovata]|uniref:Peptidyl-prolyl cis-trans isomerase n=1 Tax=Rhodotorula diobovata TaxID=5288 RepID=A0A5C5FMT7_9BASI|nr:cyclophilin-like domain-containing protein [Rhodotorula diobovata]
MAPNCVLQTSMGEIVFELYDQHAPKTCRNFRELCSRGYYSGTIFHRIIADFMIQGGDPTVRCGPCLLGPLDCPDLLCAAQGTGRGGVSIYGDKFEDEIHPDLRHTGAGILSMANSGPNTNGSQFFITLAPTPHLDRKHTIFGRVASGMQVVQRLGAVATDAEDRPRENIRIIKSRVVDA